jgi:hypothetical protein
MDPAIELALAARDSFRKKLEADSSIEERVRELFTQMSTKVPGAGMTPEGYQHFLRHNFRQRAVPSNDVG